MNENNPLVQLKLFDKLKHSQRNALFALICLHLPVEARNSDMLSSKCWSYQFLSILLIELKLPETFLEAYAQLVDKIYIDVTDTENDYVAVKEAHIKPFLEELKSLSIDSVINCLLSLMVLLILRNIYDGRGRTLMRNLLYTLSHSSLLIGENGNLSNLSTLFTLADAEGYIIKALEEKYKQVTKDSTIKDAKATSTSSTSSTLIRFAQIGAVTIGTGAILALTGGLAAPALAAIWGMSFLGTAGVCASLFGGAGAGLAAYKMTKRTRGITEFTFEFPVDAQHHHGRLSVMIMVSGFLFKKEDQKRAFGLIPDTIQSDERLVRYYRVHDPEKIADATNEAKEYYKDPTVLYQQLTEKYGQDPTKIESLAPPYIDSYLPQQYKNSIDQLLSYYIQELANPSSDRTTEASINSVESTDDTFDNAPYSFTTIKSDKNSIKKNTVNDVIEDSTDVNKKGDSNLIEIANSSDDTANCRDDIVEDEKVDIITELPVIDHSFGINLNKEHDGTSIASDFEDLDINDENEKNNEIEIDLTDLPTDLPKPELTAEESFIIETSFGSKLWHWRELKISTSYEPYVLTWETDTQINLGNSIARMMYNLAVYSGGQLLVRTLFYSLMTAVMLPVAILSLTASIDGVWTMAIIRADLAGVELAKALIARPQGSRPVTLVGYSIGARVIFSCLKELFIMRYCHLMKEDSMFSSSKDPPKKEPTKESNEKKSKMSSFTKMFSMKSSNNSEEKQEEDYDEWKVYSQQKKSDISSIFNISDNLDDELNDDVNNEVFHNDHYSIPVQPKDDKLHELPMELDENLVDETIRGIEHIVQDVVLLGAPVRYKSKFWKWIRMVVSGRIINCYSKNDLILGLVYRYQRFGSAVSGVESVPCPGIENIDISHLVEKHVDYSKNIKDILEYIDLTQPNLPVDSSHIVL